MGLIMLWIVLVSVGVHIKCFEVVSIDDSPNRLIDVSPPIALRGCLSIILLIFRIGESPRKWL